VLAAIGTFLTVPEFRCSIGLLADTCPRALKEVELITQTELGEALPGVKVQVVGRGAPEVHYTDTNGYLKVNMASKGDVRVNLSVVGYPVQDIHLNLAIDPNTVRVVRFARSGSPAVTSQASPPPVVVSPASPSPSPSTSLISLANPQDPDASPGYEDDIIRAKVLGA
jgi:hypothetical protein